MNGDTQFAVSAIKNGGTVSAPATAPTKDGFTFTGWYLANAETAFDFTTAINEDTTLYAHFDELTAITYLDPTSETGTTTVEPGNYNIITSTTTEWSGTMVAVGKVTIDSEVALKKHTNLILCDGAELIVDPSIGHPDDVFSNAINGLVYLNIFVQSGKTGKLSAISEINGLKATQLNIYGGNITTSYIYITGAVNIYGGSITTDGITSTSGDVNISGGNIYPIEGQGCRITTTSYNITLGWTNPTDSIKVIIYSGTVNFTKPFVIEDGTLATSDNINGQTLTPAYAVTFKDGETTLSEVGVAATGTATVAKPDDPTKEGCVFVGWYTNPQFTGDPFDFTTAITADTTLYAHFTNFSDLQSLINATADNGTLVLDSDYKAETGEPGLVIPEGKTMTLDLNGHTIDRGLTTETEDGYVIMVNGNLTLKDSSDGTPGKITGGNNSYQYGGGVYVSNGGTFTMTGGTISGNTAVVVDDYNKAVGGGVYVAGTFTMTGGTISGNTANEGLGGGVYVDEGTFTITGGTISGNNANYAGGGVYVSGTFTMTGGTISDNRAKHGGVYVDDYGTFYLKNGVDAPAGVDGTITRFGTVTINNTTGGTITDTSASKIALPVGTGHIANETVTLTVAPASFSPVVTDSEGETVSVTNAGNGTFTFTMSDKDVTVEPEKFTVAVTSRTTASEASVADLTVSPGNTVSYGAEVTVTAPDKQTDGYSFKGWFPAETTAFTDANRVSPNLAYTFNVTAAASLMAVYEANGSATVTIAVVNGAKYTVGSDTTVKTGGTETIQLGKTLTITADDAEKVLQWQNESGKVLGKGSTLEFTVTGNTSVTLVYKSVENNQSFVQFVSDFGQVLSYNQYSATSNITFPTVPTKFGYNFVKWVFEGTDTEATEAAIKAKIGTESIITIKPSYTQDSTTYNVTVKYSGITRDDDNYNAIPIGTGYSVTAPEIENYNFECWKIGESIVSYKTDYYWLVNSNITLTACYVSAETEVEAQPVITISNLYTVTAGTVHKVSCDVTRSIPDGYALVEHGVLYAKSGEFTAETFIIGGAGVSKYKSDKTAMNGNVTLNVSVLSDDSTVSLRGYMVLKNNKTGNIETLYTAYKCGTYDALKPTN